jgi:NADPH-dependent glutamate synthase beta subunit-like oxidoreductase
LYVLLFVLYGDNLDSLTNFASSSFIPLQALVSIGYKGLAIPGTEQWYDDTSGVITNTHGLVDGARTTDAGDENSLAGLYVTGWLKRGPSGIIGTNIADAKDTVATIVKDSAKTIASAAEKTSQEGSLLELLKERGVQVVDWRGYQKIDAAEMDAARRRHPDQPREKFTTRRELLEAASAD